MLPSVASLTLIQTIKLTTAGQLDFQNIPQTFEHLALSLYARSTAAAQHDVIMMRLNGDATASYIGQQLIGFASTAAAAALGAAGEGRIGACPGSGATANFYGAIETRFPGYRQSGFKPWISQAFGLQGRRLDGHARRWLLEQDDRDQSPASIPNAGPNLVAGSMGTLYGLRG